jgi:hypothetical protein
MPSEFALQVAQRYCETTQTVGAKRLAGNVDAELAEVREVLDVTRRRASPDGPCWCKSYLPTLGHTEDCQRARALYERLEIK